MDASGRLLGHQTDTDVSISLASCRRPYLTFVSSSGGHFRVGQPAGALRAESGALRLKHLQALEHQLLSLGRSRAAQGERVAVTDRGLDILDLDLGDDPVQHHRAKSVIEA